MGCGLHESAHSRKRWGQGQERNRGRGRAETRAGTTGTNVHFLRVLSGRHLPGAVGREKLRGRRVLPKDTFISTAGLRSWSETGVRGRALKAGQACRVTDVDSSESLRSKRFRAAGGKSPWGAGFTKVHVRVNGRVQGECVNVSGPRASTGVVPRQRMCTFVDSLRSKHFGARGAGKAHGDAGFTKVHIRANVGGVGQERNRGRGRAETRAGTTGTKVHIRVNGRPSGRVHERVRAPSFDGGSAEAKDPGRSGRGVGAVGAVTR